MSRPRVNASSEERDGQRGFLSVPTEMYADREIGARNFRRRSIRDRLGGNVEHFSFSRQNNGKRAREDDGKWKHDLFEDKDVEEGQIVNSQVDSQDLRSKLAQQESRISGRNTRGPNAGMSDLREKLSGPVTQRPPVAQAPGGTELQHRLPSVVRSTSNVAQPERSTPLQKTSGGGDDQTVGGLLHSLGLGKYSITFQAEEVDMAALRHMTDNDLKELGVPMGPRKKILQAVGTHV